jgi:hypothetical protein
MHVFHESRGHDLTERSRDFAGIDETSRAAFFRKKIEREGRIARGGKPPGDVANVIGETAVFVHDEHGAERIHRRCPGSHQGAT